MPAGSIVRLQPESLPQLEDLLRRNSLPAEDCVDQAANFYGIFDGAKLIAAGGLERVERFALLRSVVVMEPYRASGLARKISDHLIDLARAEGRQAVYLLTETAVTYFEKLGFSRLERARVPRAIQQTRQFASLCPDTASCMVLMLPVR